jgi:hypothetical protein
VSVAVQVSEGFKNVAALLDHLNVDASNPLAVLTQVCHMQCVLIIHFYADNSGSAAFMIPSNICVTAQQALDTCTPFCGARCSASNSAE